MLTIEEEKEEDTNSVYTNSNANSVMNESDIPISDSVDHAYDSSNDATLSSYKLQCKNCKLILMI